MGFFKRKSFTRIPKQRKITDTEAVRRQEAEGRSIYDKAFDDYMSGKISKSQFDARVARSVRKSRGY